MIGINIKNTNTPFADLIVDGLKTIETRNSRSLHPYIGKRVAIVRTGKGKALAIGECTIDGVFFVGDAVEFDKHLNRHHVTPNDEFYIGNGGKYLYTISNPIRYDVPKNVALGIVARKVLEG